MIIEKVSVETATEYSDEPDDYSNYNSRVKTYVIKLKIPLPGGAAIYSLVTSEKINSNIETAAKLSKQVEE